MEDLQQGKDLDVDSAMITRQTDHEKYNLEVECSDSFESEGVGIRNQNMLTHLKTQRRPYLTIVWSVTEYDVLCGAMPRVRSDAPDAKLCFR